MPEPGRSPDHATFAATRRGFLRLAGGTTALAALAQIRVLPPAAAAASDAGRFFEPGETRILGSIVERMVDTGEPGAPRVGDTGALASLDALCRGLPPEVSDQLRLALQLFEWGPVVFDWRLSRFTALGPEERDASLRGWMESRFALRRLAFLALRNLSLLGYYSQPETWQMIGYRGPLVGRRAP